MLTGAFLLLIRGTLFTMRLGNQAGSFPRPLSAREEESALERWSRGDMEARNLLIEHNLRLVAHIIKKYYTSENEQDDLISIGTIGLIKGISSFRPDKGARLSTYLSRCIENEVLMYFRANRKTAGDVSLADSIDSDADAGSLQLMDVLTDDTDMAEQISSRELCARLEEYMASTLEAREARILRLRYGMGGGRPLTQRETADECGISRSYVSRLEKRALEKMRKQLEED